MNAKELRQNFLPTQLDAYYVFHIIFIFYKLLYNKHVNSFSWFIPNIFISLKDSENSYKQLKTGRKMDSKKVSLKKIISKEG